MQQAKCCGGTQLPARLVPGRAQQAATPPNHQRAQRTPAASLDPSDEMVRVSESQPALSIAAMRWAFATEVCKGSGLLLPQQRTNLAASPKTTAMCQVLT